MARSFRHARNNRSASRRASQRSTSHGTATTSDDSQRTRVATPPHEQPPKKRGRKTGSQTKLRLPQQGAKVALKPVGDMQFSYVNYKPLYKYTTQLGAILRIEYPATLIEDKDEDGNVIGRHEAVEWEDYFLNTESVMTSGERVLSEFWRLFEVEAEDQEEADQVLENYLKYRVRDMLYQARVEAVKEYYRTLKQELDDKLARPIVLEYDQYLEGKIKWVDAEVWPELCRYWCSKEFLKQRKRGQFARLGGLNLDNPAQNHGGSRPFTETQQVLETMYGPEKATPLNVYAVMKSGIKSVDSTGTHGAIRSNKAQKRMDDYIEGARRLARPEEEDENHENEGHEDMEEAGLEEDHVHEQHLNEQVLYDVSAGPRNHGRLAIGNGAIKVADVRAVAKERRVRPSNPVSMQSMAREMARLRSANARLQQENHEKDNALQHYKVTTELTLDLYRTLGKEIPHNALQRLSAAQAIATGSSHVGSKSTNNSINVDVHDGEGLGGAHMDESNHESGNNACV